MKRPRTSITVLSFFALALSSLYLHRKLHQAAAASLRATQSPAGDSEIGSGITSSGGGGGDRGGREEHSSQLDPPATSQENKEPLNVKLSTLSRPHVAHSTTITTSSLSPGRKFATAEDAPEIPLIGVGVGNLPHNKIPFILATALSLPSTKRKMKGSEIMDEELKYRLIDTSHTDSALEVLVGRSLSRLATFAPSSAGGTNGNDKITETVASSTSSNVYHVIIKIWHTHLGYERTMLSIQDSLSDILPNGSFSTGKKRKMENHNDIADEMKNAGHDTSSPDVRIHAMLQYPRCYDSLFSSRPYQTSPNFPQNYDNCQAEEDGLDDTVKSSGPSPLLDKENAWKRSYRALEELYYHGTLESIGVSNFGPADMADLFKLATVGPHIYQGTLHTLLTQDVMVEDLVKHGVHYQCYDVSSMVVAGRESAPRAYAALERIGATHGGLMDNESGGDGGDSGAGHVYGYSAVQVALGWLLHHRGVGVIASTRNVEHLTENSPTTLGGMPRFNPREALNVEMALRALVNGEDLVGDQPWGAHPFNDSPATEDMIDANGVLHHDSTVGLTGESGVVATFFNTLPSGRNVRIFHVHPDTGEQIQLSNSIPSGRSGRMIVNWEDVLIAYDGHGTAVKKFLVEELNGSVDFTVG